ncbi:hypothetical protein GCM10022278_21160 [Allohahella marinimesophila]|uniref:Uncharacterized protein n=1 Tax=Allohahella marinimesophila TaxID=1054972 RepID=A0ABP7PBW0_9GAMM
MSRADRAPWYLNIAREKYRPGIMQIRPPSRAENAATAPLRAPEIPTQAKIIKPCIAGMRQTGGFLIRIFPAFAHLRRL